MSPFEYILEVPAENIEEYCPGGYHPVHLGVCFKDGQYKVINKLGYGSFATVWLARDLQAHRNVTLKIVVAKKSGELNHELRILKHLKKSSDSSHPGHKHISHLLDFFYLNGPNGQHLCLVFDVLGPNTSSVAECCKPDYRLDGCMGRDISAQVLLAVEYLHLSGIVHGDIHTGNILFRIPGLDSLSPENFGQPKIGKVTRRDGQPSGEGVPEYLVQPINFRAQSTHGLSEVQLIDFGESFFVGHSPKTIDTPIPYHPPELVFKLELTNAVDIWNLGCTIYELIAGRSLFEALFSDHKLIPQFKKVIGDIPESWISNALQDNVLTELPNDAKADGFLPLEDQLTRSYFAEYLKGPPTLSKDDIRMLGKCLKKMLILDPRNRAQAFVLLQDPWFKRSAKKGASSVLAPRLVDISGFCN